MHRPRHAALDGDPTAEVAEHLLHLLGQHLERRSVPIGPDLADRHGTFEESAADTTSDEHQTLPLVVEDVLAPDVGVRGEPPVQLGVGQIVGQRLVITAQPDGEYVRMSKISQIALAEVVATALERDVVGDHGWTQFVADHPDDDPVAVDALVYLISHALGGQKPSATVALARGLSPATGPKHVARARERGLIPPAEPGRSSGTGS